MNDLSGLREENNRILSETGCIMPTIFDFDKKVALATTLWPQINKAGGIDYLFGKGVGVELAIRGQVKGREKNQISFPYRSHSDFEIYDCNGYDEIPASRDFTTVFGSQEWYPKTSTKGLHDIEADLMDSTYDTVLYNGHNYLVPELEILFLDKYLKQESTARLEGCDAVLLLKQYHLDIDKINLYYERYFKKPEMVHYYQIYDKDKLYKNQVNSLLKYLNYLELDDYDLSSLDLDTLELSFNEEINFFRNNPNVGVFGGYIKFYPQPIKLCKKMDNSFDFTDECKAEMKELIVQNEINFLNELDRMQNEINDLYYSIYGMGDKKQR